VFAGIDGVVCADVEGSSVLSDGWDKPRCYASIHFKAKIEMAMRCRGVVGKEVGVKCCGMQGCCVGGRLGVTSCQSIVQVAASTKSQCCHAPPT